MTNPTISPAHILRQYAYGVLKANDPALWSENNYGGKVPVVPLGEESDLEQYSGPTVVYDWTDLRVNGTFWPRNRATITFGIRDTNYRRLSRSTNILKVSFGRFDESARDINQFLDRKGAPWNEIAFGTVSVGYVDTGSPVVSEGGEMMALVSVDFDYFVDYDINTTPTV